MFLQNFTVAESADSSLIIVALCPLSGCWYRLYILEQLDSAPREVFQRELDQAENLGNHWEVDYPIHGEFVSKYPIIPRNT